MTDKQIIINDVDVSGCEFRFRTYGCDCMSSNRETKVLTEGSRCADNPNCHYKKWQRKEQECEDFKQKLLDKTYAYSVMELSRRNSLQQLDQLEAENVELKKWKETVVELFERTCRCKYLNEENNHCGFYNRKCIGRLNQCLYKNQQALTEIKEIVETCCKIADCKKCNFFAICENNCVDVILQKISEVEE